MNADGHRVKSLAAATVSVVCLLFGRAVRPMLSRWQGQRASGPACVQEVLASEHPRQAISRFLVATGGLAARAANSKNSPPRGSSPRPQGEELRALSTELGGHLADGRGAPSNMQAPRAARAPHATYAAHTPLSRAGPVGRKRYLGGRAGGRRRSRAPRRRMARSGSAPQKKGTQLLCRSPPTDNLTE